MAVGYVASATSGSQASVASFNIGTLGTGARAGIVFVCTHNSATAVDTGVTWNGASMSLLYSATDTDTEPGVVRAYFLDNVTNGTITVSRTNNTTVCVGYAASISAAGATEAYQTITRVSSTQNTNANTSTTGTGASGEVAVDDASAGPNSMRFAASFTGAATPVAAGTNSTNLQSLDSTAYGSRFVRETNAGNGSRNVGFATGTTDDWALVAVAVREKAIVALPTAAALTLSGDTPTVTATNNKTALPTAASLTLTGGTPAVATPVVVLPSPVGGAGYSAAVLADSPVAYWQLGESSGTFDDASTNTNTGSPNGTITYGQTGKVGSAVLLNGSSGYISVASDASLSVGDTFTLEAWVNRTANNVGEETIFSGGADSWRLQFNNNGVEIAKQAVAIMGFSTIAVENDGWHHVVWTKSGSTNVIYIDGVDRTDTITNQTISSPAGAINIGRSTAANNYLNAAIDEVAIYGTALSSTRVAAHYSAASAGGGLVLTGATPAVDVASSVSAQPTAASLTLTGGTPTVTAPAISLPTAASLTLTAGTPAVVTTANQTSLPTAASLTLAGSTPAVTAPVAVAPTAGSLTLTGATPAVSTPRLAQPTAAALTLSGSTPTVATPRVALPTAASLSLSGATPAVATPVVSAPTAASITATGATPVVAKTENALSLPTAASLTITGATPDVQAGGGVSAQPTAASLTLTGATPAVGMTDHKVALPTAAALVLAGDTPLVATPVVSQPTAASLAIAFGTPVVAVTNNILVTPGPLGLTLTGAVPDVIGATVAAGGIGGSYRRRAPVPRPKTEPDDDDDVLLALYLS